jgi:serine/threonine protein kinase
VFHPAIIGLIGVVLPNEKTNGQIITEFMPNGSLKKQLQTKDYANQSSTMKVKIAVGVAAAMRYMHKHTIIHRHLKPGHILLDENFEPRVTDFWNIREEDEGLEITRDVAAPYYLAPELFEDSNYTEKVDVYSYAIILWEILTGHSMSTQFPVTKGMGRLLQFMSSVRDGMRPPTSGSDINLQQWVVELLECCWSGNSTERLSFEEILTKFRKEEFALLPDVDFPAVEEYLSFLEDFEETQLHH